MNEIIYKRNCPNIECNPDCLKEITYKWIGAYQRAIKQNRMCHICSNASIHKKELISKANTGKHHTEESNEKNRLWHLGKPTWMKGKTHSIEARELISKANTGKRLQPHSKEWNKRISESNKIAMHQPDIRKKHMDALAKSNYFGRAVDIGQPEFIAKWNRLGFNFKMNYMLQTKTNNLYYLDGYDNEKKVVLEYDGKYHNAPKQKELDVIRQKEVIEHLHPKRFWRYDAVNKQLKQIV
jgi:hypothetical protein